MLLWYLLLGLCITIVRTQQVTNDTTLSEALDDDSYYPPREWSDVFDWKILRVFSDKSVNVLFSPASLKVVLGILYEASSGATQKDFENSLQYISKDALRQKMKETISSLHVSPTNENKLSLSTRIYLDSGITVKDSYAKRIKEYYGTDVVPTNFSDTQVTSTNINSWASNSTLGAITRLVEPDEVQDMIMLLANAIYFKGFWKHQFPKQSTCVAAFHVTTESKIYVPFMTTTNLFYYFESRLLEARILRLPYKNSNFSMFLILPFSKGGWTALLENINLSNLYRELYFLDKKTVLVSIPKFSFKLKASYTNVLQRFGLRKIFQNSASFTGIAEGNSTILRELVVSDILQSTGIDVDEEGSTAFAATDVIIGNKIGVPDSTFNASHPFLFFIQDETTGTILFMGKVENPLYQELEIKKQFDDIEKEFPSTPKPQALNRTDVR